MKNKILPLFTSFILVFSSLTFALDTPTEDFIDNNDGTVTHKKTGLTWQRCVHNQTWSAENSSCSYAGTAIPFRDAISKTSSFAGYSDWRMPRIDELSTIVEFNAPSAINNIIFPNLPSSVGNSNNGGMGYFIYNSIFWSSTEIAATSMYTSSSAYTINFQTGLIGQDATVNTSEPASFTNYNRSLRFVRGGRSLNTNGKFTPTDNFIDNNDGTVRHKTTNLTWQRCSIGQTWDGNTCVGTATKMSYTSAASSKSTFAGYMDWRLPNVSELLTIVEYSKPSGSAAINDEIFPNTTPDFFSSSIPSRRDNNWSWVVGFYSGGVSALDNYSNDTNRPVRLVRGTWTIQPTIDLSPTLSASSSRVKINENLTYTATVINNGTGTANNSLLKIYLPPRNVSVVSMPSDCMTTGKSITCSLGNLATGANASRAITVTYIKSGGASVGALALTDSEDTNSENNFSRVVTAIKK